MTEVNEPIGEPTTDPDSGLDPDVIDELADDTEPVTTMAGVRRLRAEARRLRHLLREEQANRQSEQETNLARIAEYERRAVEAAASTVLIDPEDLYRHTDEATQASFNDEFGAITADHVIAAAKKLVAERPHLAKPPTARPPTDRPIEGLRGGAAPEVKKTPVSWSSAIRGSGA